MTTTKPEDATENETYPRSSLIYTIGPEQRKALLSSDPKTFELTFSSLIKGIRDTYEQEGLVLIRGLLEEDSLNKLAEDGQAIADAVKLGSTFTSLKFGSVFSFPSGDEKEPLSGQIFRDTALTSTIPAFVAKVLFDDIDNNEDQKNGTTSATLRMLKDAFLAKGKEKKHCGWHVDDAGFWPTDCQSNGVNVWIALDDIPEKYGGGMAVSPKSHTAEWREAAYETIGSTKIFPPEGIGVDSKLFSQVYGKTCGMATLDPDLNERIESSKIEFDYQKGDCLFCTRWLFHRSVQINEEGMKHYSDDQALKRYTVRYERGTARLVRGLSVENCVLMDSENGGKSLDAVCESGGPFYPLCWPPLPDPGKQQTQMEKLVRETFPDLEVKRKQAMKEVMELLNKNKPKSSGY